MKKALLLLSLLAASVFAGGCETTQTSTAAERSESEATTGSRIPRRAGSFDAAGGDAYKQGQIDRPGTGGTKGL